jgi:hypothetical protein
MPNISKCTIICGPAMDGKLCSACKMPALWAKVKKPTFDEMRIQCDRWTGDWTRDGQPRFDLRGVN